MANLPEMRRVIRLSRAEGISSIDFDPPLSEREFAGLPIPHLRELNIVQTNVYSMLMRNRKIWQVGFLDYKYYLDTEDLQLYAKQVEGYLGNRVLDTTVYDGTRISPTPLVDVEYNIET